MSNKKAQVSVNLVPTLDDLTSEEAIIKENLKDLRRRCNGHVPVYRYKAFWFFGVLAFIFVFVTIWAKSVIMTICCAIGCPLFLVLGMSSYQKNFENLESNFSVLKRKCKYQLGLINKLMLLDVEELRKQDTDVANITTLVPDVHAKSVSSLKQKLPCWWFCYIPFQLIGLVLGGPLLWVFDMVIMFSTNLSRLGIEKYEDDDIHLTLGWRADMTTSLYYVLTFLPWLKKLYRTISKQQNASRFEKIVKEALKGIHGVKFETGPKKRVGRAIAKARDSYMPPMPLSSLHPWTLRVTFLNGLDAIGESSPCLGSIGCLLAFPIYVAAQIVFVPIWLLVFRVLTSVFLVGKITSIDRIIDIVRGLVVCDSGKAMKEVVDRISARNEWEVLRIKNGWSSKTSGYMQILINIRWKDTKEIHEVQITHRKVYEWRKHTHLVYQVLRADSGMSLHNDLVRETQKK